MELLQLAEEVLMLILVKLDGATLLVCRRVCRDLARIIANTVSLQYNIELALAGMVHGSAGPLTTTA